LFYEADRGPRPAAQPENRPRRDLVAPVCSCPRIVPARFSKSDPVRTANTRKRRHTKQTGGPAYANVHTAKNAAGEIRGQVKVSS